jgi:hypothetical protein
MVWCSDFGRSKRFSVQNIQTSSGDDPDSSSVGTGIVFRGKIAGVCS